MELLEQYLRIACYTAVSQLPLLPPASVRSDLRAPEKTDRHVQRAHPFYRRVEIIEGAIGDDRGDLCRDTVALIAFVDDDRPAGFFGRFDADLFALSRGTVVLNIDDLGADAARLQRICRCQRRMQIYARSLRREAASLPVRFTSATPKGMVYSSAGTAPFNWYIILFF